MRIRLANDADIPVLQKLVAHAATELAEKYGTPRMDTGLMQCLKYGIDTKQAVVLAEQEQPPDSKNWEVVGWCARVHLPGLPPGQVEGLGTWVHEPYRRERVGADMRAFADKRAKELGAKFVTGIAAKDNVAGVRSCLDEGYEVVGYQMRKNL